MKILLVTGPGISLKEPYQSGIEAFIVSFANQLAEIGHNVDVVAGEAGSNSKFNLLDPFGKFSVNRLNYYRYRIEAQEFINLPIDSYDVVHYNMFYPHLIEAGMHSRTKIILTLHSPVDEKRISFYKKLSERRDLTFVAISARIKTQYNGVLNTDMPLIGNGIDIGDWHTPRARQPEHLLWSARITPEKNAVAAIRLAQSMDMALKIAGRIVDQAYFRGMVEPHLNCQIQYVGHVTQRELKCLAHNASTYIATATWQEPFGLAALEMLASGVPVVGFDTAVPQEWQHESVLTTSSHQWRDLVALVIKSRAISSETCKEFASNMSIGKMTSDYLKLYNEVLLGKEIA